MKIRVLAAVAAISLAGTAVFAQDVKVDFDKDANFSTIKTFAVKIGTPWATRSARSGSCGDRAGAHREGLDEGR